MKALFIGGTGTISMAITRAFLEAGHTLYLLNRGSRNEGLEGDVHYIIADINREEEKVREAIKDLEFDVVADFIVFTRDQAERDVRLFSDKTAQYMTFSSASAYHKPLRNPVITEGTTVANPYWQYSRDKIEVENYLMKVYREEGFPVTIVRPSHTYDERRVTVGVHGKKGPYQIVKRIKEGKPVIIPGDGTSLWTITFNTDFAKGFLGLMGNPRAIGETYHITSDESCTWNQIHEAIARALGKELIPYHVSSDLLAALSDEDLVGALTGDKSNSVIFDNTKIKRAVPGFVCTVRADEGIRRSVAYMEAHPECQVEDPEFDAWCDRVIAAIESMKKTFKEG